MLPLCNYDTVNAFFVYQYESEPEEVKKCTQTQAHGTQITFDPFKVHLLTSPLQFGPMNRVKLGKSSIHEHGVFAAKDIRALELVTFYPADVVLFHCPVNDSSICISSSDCKAKYTTVEEQTKQCLQHRDKVFDLDASMAIQVFSDLHDGSNNNFLGHFINDECVQDPFSISEEEYKARVMSTSNCMMLPTKHNLYVTVVATKKCFCRTRIDNFIWISILAKTKSSSKEKIRLL